MRTESLAKFQPGKSPSHKEQDKFHAQRPVTPVFLREFRI